MCAQSCLTLCQAPLPMEFPRQEYWSGLPFPPLGDHPDPGIEPLSPELAGRFFTTELPGKPINMIEKQNTDLGDGVVSPK